MQDDVPPTKAKQPRARPALKAVPKSAPPEPAVKAKGETTAAVLRKAMLLDRVGLIAKGKKKDVKEAVEATLLVLGEALARGEELNLPPFGKAKVTRQKGVKGGDHYVIKLRRAGKGEEPLADGE